MLGLGLRLALDAIAVDVGESAMVFGVLVAAERTSDHIAQLVGMKERLDQLSSQDSLKFEEPSLVSTTLFVWLIMQICTIYYI